ncbi:cytochrome P450 [Burkholderia ambifaria]|uniref:cytochrome P450 n=1 Tax=Burkholderia ambifaria TaxID=152480 RepID=UPI002445DB9F|nr:cytochrome P450 [Burkholderia ambifaria]
MTRHAAIDALPGPPGRPLVGNALQIEPVGAYHILKSGVGEYGAVCRFRIGRRSVVAVADVNEIDVIMRERPRRYRRRSRLEERGVEIGANGVFLAEGERWHQHRKVVTQAPRRSHIAPFFDRLSLVTQRPLRQWTCTAEGEVSHDVTHSIAAYTTDVVSGPVFGEDLYTLEGCEDRLQAHLKTVFRAVARRQASPLPDRRCVRLRADRQADPALQEIRRGIGALIARARCNLERFPERAVQPTKMIESLVAAQQSDNMAGVSDEEIAGNVMTLLLAGKDTTANTIAWAMHWLTCRPDVQCRLQGGMRLMCGERRLSDSPAMLDAMPYPDAVALETMRLRLAFPIIFLELLASVEIAGVPVPAATPLAILAGRAGAQANCFSASAEFRPERWLERVLLLTQNLRGFLPFGSAARLCRGKYVVMLEVRMAVAALAHNFTVVAAPSAPPSLAAVRAHTGADRADGLVAHEWSGLQSYQHASQPNALKMNRFDYLVVGGGAAGCTLAARLAYRLPRSQIALVEAGPGTSGPLTAMPAATAIGFLVPSRRIVRYRTVPQSGLQGRSCELFAGRGLGGGTGINAMVYVRGHAEDYNEWQACGCDGWGWRDVLPYFLKSENNARGASAWHATGGPLNVADVRAPHVLDRAFIDAAIQTGIPANHDFNAASQDGAGYYQVTQQDGRRCSAAAFLPRKIPSNLTVLSGCTALRIVFEQRRATALIVAHDNGHQQTLLAREEIVLSAGAIGTPQLLMCSGIGPPDDLARMGIATVCASLEVGRNLQDHPDFLRCFRVRGVTTLGLSLRCVAGLGGALLRYYRSGAGILTTNGAQCGAFLRTDPQALRPDVQIHFVTALLDNHGGTLATGHGFACHVCVLRPHSRGTVRLQHCDARVPPVIDSAILQHADDVQTLLRGVRAMNRILAAPALAGFEPRPLHPMHEDSDAAWIDMIRQRTGSAYHLAGTCRMGADAGAVVDAQLRVVGAHALRIADASVMPTLVAGNTQAGVIMIAERAADWIVQAAPPQLHGCLA